MKKTLLLAMLLTGVVAWAAEDPKLNAPAAPATPPTTAVAPVKVTVRASDADVRRVLADLFDQAKQQFVLQPGIRFSLFLHLRDAEFIRALEIICTHANLEYELKDGIYFVRAARGKPGVRPAATAPVASRPAVVPVAVPTTRVPQAPVGTLPTTVLTRRLTTRFDKTDLRAVLANIASQTNVTIEVDSEVPAYRIDAYLINTSLKFALDEITRATGLRYSFTNRQSIAVRMREESRVAVVRAED